MEIPKQVMTDEQVDSFFHNHWTVRKYKTFTMPKRHLDLILMAAQRAPTDATAQLYSLIRLTDKELRQKISELSGNPHIATASEAFVVCADVHRLHKILQLKGFEAAQIPQVSIHFGIGDAVMAGQNLLLAAELLGYRGCWIGGVLNHLEQVSALLDLPKNVFPFAGLTVGLPDEPAQHRPRLPRSQVIFENSYKQIPDQELMAGIEQMGPITARGDWAATLARYFGKGGSMQDREVTLSNYLNLQMR